MGSSYVSQQWVSENPEAVLDRRKINFEVKFGDSRTTQALKEEVRDTKPIFGVKYSTLDSSL